MPRNDHVGTSLSTEQTESCSTGFVAVGEDDPYPVEVNDFALGQATTDCLGVSVSMDRDERWIEPFERLDHRDFSEIPCVNDEIGRCHG